MLDYRKSSLAAACIFPFYLLSVAAAHAEAPMNTDDAGTLGIGGMKIEGVASRDDRTRGTELGFGYGLVENVEVGLTFSHEYDRTDDPSTKTRGTGFSVKWVPIQNETGWSLGASFGYDHARAHIRSATPPDPERETTKGYSVTGLASYRFETDHVVHLNLGAVREKTEGVSNGFSTWSAGYEYPLLGNLKLTVEAFGQSEDGSRPDKSLGLRYEIDKGLKVSGSAGYGNGRGFGQVGFAWEF